MKLKIHNFQQISKNIEQFLQKKKTFLAKHRSLKICRKFSIVK